MTKTIILVNGPARSGKDTIGNIIAEATSAQRCKFASALKRATHAFFHALRDDFNLSQPAYVRQAATLSAKDDAYYEDSKAERQDLFRRLTPREAYIEVSETFMKKTFGAKVFGNILADEIERTDAELFVVTDSGFQGEAEVLIDRFGAENVKLIRVGREGYTFEGDSRGYIELPVSTVVIQNNGTLPALRQDVSTILDSLSIANIV